ncbi:hypothetical protein LAZ67_23002247 [Cordylochernes scorpioides]|uniref:Carboxylesterase type B domain-containing protein n=1 Tax=Cordylochernes scorpioides TaxID=51811 RepID=A0ABY6LR63_9ARAC|nr:hypothetical protein LAZ67_23002247 [Cordylochernes scorpioides]
MDQRTCIKFCVKNEIKCADAFRMLTVAYGELPWTEATFIGERAGRPSTSTTDEKINEVEKMILANRRITVREVAEDLNISIGSWHSIFINDLGMRRVAAKFVSKLLNCDQKQHRMNIANEMLDFVRDDPNLLQRVITGDEAGVVHHEFLQQGRTVNKEYYLQVMRNLREAIRQKRPDLWKNKNWLLHHDNAPAHTSLLICPPCDFFLFPKLKRPMKGRRYATLDEIKTASKEELKNIFKNDFLKCFEDWKNRWHKCIISHGDYFEGDKIAAWLAVASCGRVVTTKYGKLRGVPVLGLPKNSMHVESFLGIPYASPPVGSLRFMPPVTPAHWSDIRTANQHGPACPQRPPIPDSSMPLGRQNMLRRLLPFLRNQSEDCLYLNIFSPIQTRKACRILDMSCLINIVLADLLYLLARLLLVFNRIEAYMLPQNCPQHQKP